MIKLIYYYIAAGIYMLLAAAATYLYPSDSAGYSPIGFHIIIPVVALILGLPAGRAKSFTKWGFPIYLGLLSFVLSVLVYTYEDWGLVLMGFLSSLAGVIAGHVIHLRKKAP